MTTVLDLHVQKSRSWLRKRMFAWDLPEAEKSWVTLGHLVVECKRNAKLRVDAKGMLGIAKELGIPIREDKGRYWLQVRLKSM